MEHLEGCVIVSNMFRLVQRQKLLLWILKLKYRPPFTSHQKYLNTIKATQEKSQFVNELNQKKKICQQQEFINGWKIYTILTPLFGKVPNTIFMALSKTWLIWIIDTPRNKPTYPPISAIIDKPVYNQWASVTLIFSLVEISIFAAFFFL